MADFTLSSYISLRNRKFSGLNIKKLINQPEKIKTNNTHGTGCTLSSAIATYYSCGKTLKKSCEMAINYVNHAIRSGPEYGKGHSPINHLNTINIKKNFK